MSENEASYGLSPQVAATRIPAPMLPYLPKMPRAYRPKIGLIGAGGIAEYHLRAYRTLGLEVAAIADIDLERARQRRDEFYPQADIATDYRDVLRRDEIEVVDLALHPAHRGPVIEASIEAGKHILSQKPLAEDLDMAKGIVERADRCGVRLAVNQNGRWAPHFAYAREAVRAGLLGTIGSMDFQLAFDHSWIVGTPFEEIRHLVLHDFGIHWFDMAACLLGRQNVRRVYASIARTAYQRARPPMLASVVLDADAAQVRIAFNAAVIFGQRDQTLIAGSLGTLHASGPSLSRQTVVLTTAAGEASPELCGTWFENGFQGTMAELLCAVEENRDPSNSARDNLRSLALSLAAMRSADTGVVVHLGE